MDSILRLLAELDAGTRAAVVGGGVTAALGLVKLAWPKFGSARKVQKFAVAVLVAFAGGYATGGWQGGLVAALAALGAYDGSKNLRRLVGGG